ncbi:MAG TPA: alpha/beta hydrolase [Chitinophagaceae bacterium]|jgi:pimeloyl-ACP methyl ester carboxylesterase|nr:alpha/beta hydrolase [Chitinophagaceae bacterium]
MRFKVTLLLLSFILFACVAFAQNKTISDSSVNNLVHTPGYKTSEYAAIPRFTKKGNGKQTLILIPGLGFDASVFDDFINANKKNYTMYAITVPGYGNTNAPPMPLTDSSYGDQNWSKGIIEGLMKLIKKQNLRKPVIVGHFVQGTQLALRMAIDHPDKVGSVIILGGPVKFIYIDKGEPKPYPLKAMISYIDKYTAPAWFKTMSHKKFNDGNYLPEIYSLDSTRASNLWKQSASQPLPVMVRYLCEFFASDITLELEKIKCPVLVLRATFNDKILLVPINNYVRPQFIDSWNEITLKNPSIRVKDIQGAASFVWKDKPAEVYTEIKAFLSKPK